ncbi:hypothetical protein CFC21_100188 [Triticum aestivum]|uniref:Uncharacterized protein n=2 Tax=Triticum aestivum TaxID=4565 RepID=A0A3B6RMQ5_WHEAT|nr:hypothetical protein CFC21_100188 [Triticum aestivum]
MAPSTITATLLLLLACLVAGQTVHAARGLLQHVEAPSPLQGVSGWAHDHDLAEAPVAAPNSAPAPAESAPSSTLGFLWRTIWWFDEPYFYRRAPGPGSIRHPY